MSSHRYSAMLDELAIHVGIDPRALAQGQEVVVDGFAIGMHHDPSDPQAVMLFCTVTELPSMQAQLIASVLMKANFVDQLKDRVTLGLKSGCDEIVAACRVDLDESVHVLSQRMRHLSLTAHDWRLLVRFLAEQPVPAAPPAGFYQ